MKSTAPWDKNGKKGDKPSFKSSAITSTKFGSTKGKGRDQVAAPKDPFTFTRISQSTATPQSTQIEQEEDILKPDPKSLPELPPGLKCEGYSTEMEMKLRQAVVITGKMPNRPSIAAIPENTPNDPGMGWVNNTLAEGCNMDPRKVFSECKVVPTDEENGWHPARVQRSNSKASSSTATEKKKGDWPKLGK